MRTLAAKDPIRESVGEEFLSKAECDALLRSGILAGIARCFVSETDADANRRVHSGLEGCLCGIAAVALSPAGDILYKKTFIGEPPFRPVELGQHFQTSMAQFVVPETQLSKQLFREALATYFEEKVTPDYVQRLLAGKDADIDILTLCKDFHLPRNVEGKAPPSLHLLAKHPYLLDGTTVTAGPGGVGKKALIVVESAGADEPAVTRAARTKALGIAMRDAFPVSITADPRTFKIELTGASGPLLEMLEAQLAEQAVRRKK